LFSFLLFIFTLQVQVPSCQHIYLSTTNTTHQQLLVPGLVHNKPILMLFQLLALALWQLPVLSNLNVNTIKNVFE
jgi:hypothetical protein